MKFLYLPFSGILHVMKSTENPVTAGVGARIRLILALMASNFMAQTATAAPPPEDCSQFVQKFYDGYLSTEKKLMKTKSDETTVEATLRENPSVFSPELAKALKDDLAASRKSPGEIVGLDFDPVLNTQEPAERYVVGRVTTKKDHFLVEVFGVPGGKKNPKPDVAAELVYQNGHWTFTNFQYANASDPRNQSLLGLLQQLKEARKKK
jgi:hypothetical protein